MKKLLLVALLLSSMSLTACKNTYDGVRAGVVEDSGKLRSRIAYNIDPDHYGKPQEQGGEYIYPQAYCYTTWTKPVCYDAPIEGEEPHLVGR